MRKKNQKQRIVFCTFSDFIAGNQGDSVNDRKLFEAIPLKYEKLPIFPKYKDVNKIEIKSIFKYTIKFLKEITSSKRIFITRAPKLAILPIVFNKIFDNRVIIRMGCTPAVFIERKSFFRNLNFKPKTNILKKIFYFLEPHLELYAIRHADGYIIENERAKKIAIFYGAIPNKIKIVPYYVQDYFLEGNNPNFNINEDFFKIGYTGRFSLYDLITPVIDSISILKDSGYNIKLFLIGDGINRKKMENYVKYIGLTENVIFLGSKPHHEVSNLINEFHCLVLPMLNNICPSTIAIKILEGVMKGKIIITTYSGNNASLFLQYKELIIDKISVDEIVEKIKLVINNYNIYKEKAEELSIFHSSLRSKEIYEEKLAELLNDIIY